MHRAFCGLTAVGMALLAQASLAGAATADKGRAAVVQALSDCRKMADREDRLACYDKAADAFDQAQAQGQVVVFDREQARAVRRQAFGFNIPSITLFNRGPKEEAVDKLSVKLSSAGRGADGKWVMTTTDDAVWRQIDDEALYSDPRPGSTVAIRHAMLGSFFCNVDGQSAIRCTRVR